MPRPFDSGDRPADQADATRRTSALAAALRTVPPSSSEEEWRYSNIDKFDGAQFATRLGDRDKDAETAAEVASQWKEICGDVSATVVVVDGWVALIEESGAAGLGLDRPGIAGPVPPEDAEIQDDYFDAVNRAVSDPIVINIAAGSAVSAPILVVQHHTGGAVLAAPRLEVSVGVGGTASIIEVHSGTGTTGVSVPVSTFVVDSEAALNHMLVVEGGPDSWHIGRSVSTVARHAKFTSAAAVIGGRHSRVRFDCALEGVGATGSLSAVYLGDGERTVDLRTFQSHNAPSTSSDLNFAGAVSGSSRAVYTGMIRISNDAPKSEAHQTNRILKLSEKAWAESVPNLEILHNDVICSHASAVGPIDDDQRFYLESRGVPPERTEKLVVQGFLASRTQAIPHEGLAAYVVGRITERLAL